jgi:hypothetical protein
VNGFEAFNKRYFDQLSHHFVPFLWTFAHILFIGFFLIVCASSSCAAAPSTVQDLKSVEKTFVPDCYYDE